MADIEMELIKSMDVPKTVGNLVPENDFEDMPISQIGITAEESMPIAPRERAPVRRAPHEQVLRCVPEEEQAIPVRIVEQEYARVQPVVQQHASGAVSVTHPSGYHPLSGLSNDEIDKFDSFAKQMFEKFKLTPEQKAKNRAELKKFARGAKSTFMHFVDSLRKSKAKKKLEDDVVPTGVAM